eukprot:GGOE01061890.1.p1 GENE.GGOE01061890.1~~GGOE01061890.1.p1  ORF type:complete len:399 (+),score=83.65 GGOE01061890.1:52-1248(+)
MQPYGSAYRPSGPSVHFAPQVQHQNEHLMMNTAPPPYPYAPHAAPCMVYRADPLDNRLQEETESCMVYVAPREMDNDESGVGSSSSPPTADLSLSTTDTFPPTVPVAPKLPRRMAAQSLSTDKTEPAVTALGRKDVDDANQMVEKKLEKLQKQFPMQTTRQINCVLIGRAGNGKSSLINSVYQTLTGRTDTLCPEGHTDSSCTIKYACSPALCMHQALPLVLFDTKGLPDSNERNARALIHNLLKGKFKPDHSMNNPKFSDCYLLPQKALQIDVAVFVYAYGSVFPHRLASVLYSEAQARGITVIPVITFYDHVEHDEQLAVHLDCCRRTFNSHPLYLTNLSAFQGQGKEAAVALSKQTVVDVASQLMVYGQQHQRHQRLDVTQPVELQSDPRDCSIM